MVERYVFALSARDPAFEHKNIRKTIEWLINNGKDRPFFFRATAPKKGLPSGSIVLFSFEGQIFGQATVKDGIEGMEGKDGINQVPKKIQEKRRKQGEVVYKYQTVFDGKSVKIFDSFKQKRKVKNLLRPKKDFSQLYTYLTAKQYEGIIKSN